MQTETVDLAIVGFGFSGLAAALEARARGASVLALEARDRVGGRVLTRMVEGVPVEMGAQWTGPGQKELQALTSKYGMTVRTRPDMEGQVCFYEADETGEAPLRAIDGPGYDPVAAFEMITELDRLADELDPKNPAGDENGRILDEYTVASWSRANLDPSVAVLVRGAVEGFIGISEQVSMLHALNYARANGGFAALLGLGDELHDSEVVEEGFGELARRIAEDLGDLVQTNRPVVAVEQDASGVRVIGADGRVVAAKAVIVAMPPTVADRLRYAPELPVSRLLLQRRYTLTSRLKFQIVYGRAFWRDSGLSGSVQGGGFITFDGSPTESSAVISGFFGAREASEIWGLPEAERRRIATERLAMFLGPEALSPIGYADFFWYDEPYSMGCVSAPGPGILSQCGMALRAPVGRIFWAGSETARHMPGQIDGAVSAGRTAAAAALELI